MSFLWRCILITSFITKYFTLRIFNRVNVTSYFMFIIKQLFWSSETASSAKLDRLKRHGKVGKAMN